MTLFTEGIERGPAPHILDIEAATEDFTRATGLEAIIRSPFASTFRAAELEREDPRQTGSFFEGLAESGGPFAPFASGAVSRAGEPLSRNLPQAEAKTRVEAAGVELKIPVAGIRAAALDILIARKRAEAERQAAIARTPTTAGSVTLGLAVSLLASAVDPINVGAAFLPVFGAARQLRLLQGARSALGRTGIRAGIGTVEGVAGAALVEPIIAAAADAEQADYGLADSLLNVAVGGLLGGGLHVAAGAVQGSFGYAAARADRRTREAALRVVVGQLAEGKTPELGPLFKADPGFRRSLMDTTALPRTAEDLTAAAARRAVRGEEIDLDPARFMSRSDAEGTPAPVNTDGAARGEAGAEIEAGEALIEMLADLRKGERFRIQPRTLVQFIIDRGGIQDPGGELRAAGAPGRLRRPKAGQRQDDIGEVAHEFGFFKERPSVPELIDALVDELQGSPPRIHPQDVELAASFERRRAFAQELDELGIDPKTMSDNQVAAALAEADRARFRQTPEFLREEGMIDLTGLEPELDSAAARLDSVEAIRVADPEASARADADLAAMPDDPFAFADDLTAEILIEAKAIEARLGAEGAVDAALKPFDDLFETADAYGRALKEAASCARARG